MSTTQPELTPEQQALSDAWDAHIRSEFGAQDADVAIVTMVDHPRVNQVPLMTGGDGQAQLYEFYAEHFLPQIPPDTQITPVSRTIGQARVVDEMLVKFTHSIPMMWLLPGVSPTGRQVELAFVVIVEFEDTKLVQERLYWDHASLLVQVGLVDPEGLPVVGAEGARSVLDRSIPLNGLIDRALAAG